MRKFLYCHTRKQSAVNKTYLIKLGVKFHWNSGQLDENFHIMTSLSTLLRHYIYGVLGILTIMNNIIIDI